MSIPDLAASIASELTPAQRLVLTKTMKDVRPVDVEPLIERGLLRDVGGYWVGWTKLGRQVLAEIRKGQ